LIPVQELQGRLKELTAYIDREILVYCATGNRSTVASKILIDHDFKQIANMRYGIYGWEKKNFPMTR
jgi:rhodanese-related sulfurtransferase